MTEKGSPVMVVLPSWMMTVKEGYAQEPMETSQRIREIIETCPHLGRQHVNGVYPTGFHDLFELDVSEKAVAELSQKSWVKSIRPRDGQLIRAEFELFNPMTSRAWRNAALMWCEEWLMKDDIKEIKCRKNGTVGVRGSRRVVSLLEDMTGVKNVTRSR